MKTLGFWMGIITLVLVIVTAKVISKIPDQAFTWPEQRIGAYMIAYFLEGAFAFVWFCCGNSEKDK